MYGPAILLFTLSQVPPLLNKTLEDNDLKIVHDSLSRSLSNIINNAGRYASKKKTKIRDNPEHNFGYNAKTDTFENLFESGVIDPTKVVRSGLQNAASIAAMVLTTEALVADFEDEKDTITPQIIM